MRSVNSFRNAVVGLVSQAINLILAFIVRTVFIYTLSEQYLGVNGLFTSVISMLSLTDLGIDAAIAFALYKPVAENDIEKISGYISFLKKAYNIVGVAISVIGLCLIPFLHLIVKDPEVDVNLVIVYLLFLLESVVSYLFFAYKRVLLNADQKTYVVSSYTAISQLMKSVSRIVSLLLLRDNPVFSLYTYIFIGVLFNIVNNFMVYNRVNQLYPYIKQLKKVELLLSEKKKLYRNIFALFINKLTAVANNSIDSIIISAFIGLAATGIFSNYTMIMNSILTVVSIIFSSMTASIGNLNAIESTEKKNAFFSELRLLYFWVYFVIGVCIFALINPLISLLWTEKYVLDNLSVVIIVINFATSGFLGPITIFWEASGVYWESRYSSLCGAILNCILSVVLVKYTGLGIGGVILATIISRILIILPYTSYVVYKHVLRKKMAGFLGSYFFQSGLFIIVAIGSKYLVDTLEAYSWLRLILAAILLFLSLNILIFIFCGKTNEFKYWINSFRIVMTKLGDKSEK